MKKHIAAIAAVVASAAWGDVVTNQVNNGVSDWTLPGSYSNNRVPQANDVVEIPAGYTVTVNNASSLEVVSRLWQVRPMGVTSTIIFDFASGEVTNNSAITYNNLGGLGKIVKRGAGKLVFTAHNRFGGDLQGGTDFRDELSYSTASIGVEGGWLVMPQMITRHQFSWGKINISEGAVFALPTYDPSHPGNCPAWYCNIVGLDGYGTVTNASSTVIQLRPASGNFYGKIIGNGSFHVAGWFNLWGTENTFNGNVNPNGNSTGRASTVGTVGAALLGTPNVKSSIGTQDNQSADKTGGGFVYLGTGEKTTKKYYASGADDASGGLFFDGGMNGNLEFGGMLGVTPSTNNRRSVLYLGGTNSLGECVINCQIATNLYICKRGPGTWRLADFKSSYSYGAFQWRDSLAVEEGTLKFDTLTEAGTRCSLGYGTSRRLPYFGLYDSTKNVPYSILLGGAAEANATLQYNGIYQNTAYTRPIGVTGTGTLKGWGKTGGILGIANVWAADSAGGTLVLDGEAGTTNFIANVADSNGVLNVVKKGEGFWRLSGDIDITGDIRAEGGILEVENIPANAKYSWYRVTIREMNTYKAGGEINLFMLQEFALYDEAGKRQFLNPVTYSASAEDKISGNVYRNWSHYLVLEPGACCNGNAGNGYFVLRGTRDLNQIFNDGAPTASNADYSFIQEGSCGDGTSILAINRGNPASFFSFVMHLTNGTPPIVSYDMARYRSNYPNCWTIEASTDGIVWDEVATTNDFTCATSKGGYTQGYWISDGVTFAANASRPYSSGYGFPLSATHNTRPGMHANKIRAIGAADGATVRFKGEPVEVKGLVARPQAESSGVIENATFASNGTIYLDGEWPEDARVVSANIRLEDAGTRGNVADWDVQAGEAQVKCRARVDSDGNVIIQKSGLMLIVM